MVQEIVPQRARSSAEEKPRVGVGIMILKDSRVLLGRRHSDPEKASSELHGEGTWTMPGGKLDFHEELEDAVYREAKEETGIEIDKTKLKIINIGNEIVPDKHFVTIGYLYKEPVGEPVIMEPDEIVEWKWFDLNNLPNPIFPPSQKLLDAYKKLIEE